MVPFAKTIQQIFAALLLLATFAPLARAQYVGGYPPCQGCVDGICVPNRQSHGYYPTRWRRWPDGTMPTQAQPQEDTRPERFVLPDEREEASYRPSPARSGHDMPSQSERMESLPQSGHQSPTLPAMPLVPAVPPAMVPPATVPPTTLPPAGVPSAADGAWQSAPFVPLSTPAYMLPQAMPPAVVNPSLYLPAAPVAVPSTYMAPAVAPGVAVAPSAYVDPAAYTAPATGVAPANYGSPSGYDAATLGQIAPASYEAEPQVVLPELAMPPEATPAGAAIDAASLLPPLPEGTPAPYAPARGNPLRGR